MLVIGCGGDDSSQNDNGNTEGNDSSSSDESNTNPSTLDTTVSSTMTDPTTTEPPETTVDPDSSSSEGPCEGECQGDDECLPGQTCISCLCIGEPVGCAEWGEGSFSDCVNDEGMIDNSVCGGTNPVCLVNNTETPTAGVCLYQGCETACDCPPPPVKGFEALVACAQVGGDAQLDCFLDCSDLECPTGMYCDAGSCMWGEPPVGLPPYSDCVNEPGPCEDGICIVDNVDEPSLGWCAPACTDDDSCPAPGSGDADPVCIDFGMGNMNCELECGEGITCPDGMVCADGMTSDFCIWEVVVPVVPGYGDCANNDPEDACLGTETCFDDASGSVCTSDCTLPTDCAAAPETGDAPIACGDIGGGADTCYLDCSDGQACPDTMTCADDSYCHFDVLTYIFEEDFEGGALPKGWTIHDEDMRVPNAEVDFVDAAWVVTDEYEPGENFSAYSTSYYEPVGAADDWLVTPQITLGDASQLRWRAMAALAAFPDGYEVLVSATGSDVADFVDAPVLTVAEEAPAFTQHQVDLSAYAGQDVYIAFRNNSVDEFVLQIDDVQVSQ
ncbi:MAG: choice-of-anchor J domain-containing protein [Deltaproteobacteria bacterium]|nr:choice-of-anchor J domain-containing protein [Nannocystaceae bacterium]